MTRALAFDIYGTLINPHGVVVELEQRIGEMAQPFSNLWRDKQLEYSWRRGLMARYCDFGMCTGYALEYCNEVMQTGFDESTMNALMAAYRELPAFDDVESCLQTLATEDYRLFAFSNGTFDMVDHLLKHAGIDHWFECIISVDELKTFKPDPKVYQAVISKSGLNAQDCWLISSNPFDVTGAVACEMKAAWVRRSKAVVFDPWEYQPSVTISQLGQLAAAVKSN
ncbi:MAG: haloacid dehalogenase type II [Pseudomonadota bacterium]